MKHVVVSFYVIYHFHFKAMGRCLKLKVTEEVHKNGSLPHLYGYHHGKTRATSPYYKPSKNATDKA
ncbi:hypothetical protein [Methylomonas fluvii]|nr:hypothetical protein [Methylomonas fluvii]